MSFVASPPAAPRDVSIASLPNGQKLAYRVLGAQHLGSAPAEKQDASPQSASTVVSGAENSPTKHNSRLPLVLVNGLNSVGTVDWSPLDEHLASHRPVLVFDNRGMGNSSLSSSSCDEEQKSTSSSTTTTSTKRFSVEDMADDTVLLVKHLGWKEVDLLGFSMGGMIVQTILCRVGASESNGGLPFRVRHAVLVATST
jgi:pimeloyl-ACP methyl ester carboxylesterase